VLAPHETEGELQRRAVAWARRSLWLAAAGIAAIIGGDAAGQQLRVP